MFRLRFAGASQSSEHVLFLRLESRLSASQHRRSIEKKTDRVSSREQFLSCCSLPNTARRQIKVDDGAELERGKNADIIK